MRPERLVFVTGTHTEVGKTWCAARLLRHWRSSGYSVEARKPVQSFDPTDTEPTDAEHLAAATGERVIDVCPAAGSLPVPLAPPMAAALLGRSPPTLIELTERCAWSTEAEIGLVEGVGAVRSPVAEDGDNVDLIMALAPDVVILVADAELGAVGAVRSNIDSLGDRWKPIVFLNRYDRQKDLHRRNADWLRNRDGFTVHVSPTETATALWCEEP